MLIFCLFHFSLRNRLYFCFWRFSLLLMITLSYNSKYTVSPAIFHPLLQRLGLQHRRRLRWRVLNVSWWPEGLRMTSVLVQRWDNDSIEGICPTQCSGRQTATWGAVGSDWWQNTHSHELATWLHLLPALQVVESRKFYQMDLFSALPQQSHHLPSQVQVMTAYCLWKNCYQDL